MFERLTARSPKNGMAYLINVKQNEQVVESPYPNTLRCIMDSFNRLAEYEDSGLSPEEVQKLKKSDASKEQCTIDQHGEIHRLRDELKRYKQAEQEGRLVVLPCKVGDTVYVIVDSVDMPYVRQEKVIAIELWNKNGAMTMFIRTPYGLFEFGKTVFLTREEAEKAIGGAEDGSSKDE